MPHLTAKLIMKSYMPKTLEKGMWFLQYDGIDVSVIELLHVPSNMEEYIGINGSPVEPYIYAQEDANPDIAPIQLAGPEDLGWWDDGPETDELRQITLKDINLILQNDGWVDVEVQESEDDDESLETVLYNDMVVITYPGAYDYDDDEEEDEEYFFDDDEPFNPNNYERTDYYIDGEGEE
jgi:hypothetical protein